MITINQSRQLQGIVNLAICCFRISSTKQVKYCGLHLANELQFTEPRTPRRMLNTSRSMQSGSSSRSGHNRGAAVERNGELRAGVEADTIGEQQLKQINAIGEQQQKWMQIGSSSSMRRTGTAIGNIALAILSVVQQQRELPSTGLLTKQAKLLVPVVRYNVDSQTL